ncbi:tetratricopeptide repeat protein [Neochlamydia sp. S13]|uniref:tetratricopeptide repeat protein n=1 Tax=Neochlamydia sp. S13 TaxID=1353976 RepID=UPI0005A6993A|nr:tetratricopeptide repeat protein [Neochlamydia sp. S13]BBI18208.1 hypothetical protein NCS13_2_0011 [Neochlamydia sp. S13]
MNLENTHSSTILPTNNNSLLIAKDNTFDPSNPLATLPLKIFKQIFHSFSNLTEDELRKILDVRSCARVFKQHTPNNVKFLQLYHPQKLYPYLGKLSSHLKKNPFSIEESNNFLSTDRLEENYTHALKLAIQKEDPVQTRLCIEKLGDIHLIKGTMQTLLQAAGLYNYALHDPSLDTQESIKEKLSKVEFLLSKACKGKPVDISIIKKQFEDNRRELKKFRQEIEEKIQALGLDPSPEKVQEIYHEIALWIKNFFKSLVDQAQEILGPSPCEYAMIGFGSLAREEMTPYSDLEFGILMQEDTFGNRDYFKRLTTLLHLKVINLGETILPALNIPCIKEVDFFDSVTPRGFAFDGEGAEGKGCKTPFGNRQTFELIQTPEKMAQYIGKDEKDQWWHKKEQHLPMELLNFTHLVGNRELTKAYDEKIQEVLNMPYQGSFELRQYLARQHLVLADMIAFNPGMGDLSKRGMLFKVKNDLYRFPHLALDRLALPKKVAVSDTFSRIEQLKKKGVLTNNAAKKLNEWMSIALFMRLKTYSHYKAQKEIMNPLIKPFGFEEPILIQRQFALDSITLEKIKKIYCTFIPFYQALQDFLADNEETLQSSELNDDSCQTQGDIALRICQLDEAQRWYCQAKKDDLKNPKIFNNLGIIYAKKGNLDKAAKHVQQALDIAQNSVDKSNLNIASYHSNLGSIYQEQGNLAKAIEHLQKALDIKRELLGENHHSIANSYSNLGTNYYEQGNLAKAIEYSQRALDITKKLLGENHPNMATIYNNLGEFYAHQGNLAKAAEYIKKAGIITRELFGDNHPNIALHHNNLGSFYQEQGYLIKAVEHGQRALAIRLKFFGENHPDVAASYSNLGQIYQDQGNLEQAVEYTNKALAINLKLFGENHPAGATFYNNLGSIYQEQGNLKQAIEYSNKSLAINLKLFGENHPNVAKLYNNLGTNYQKQGDSKQAIEYSNKALAINFKLFGENHSAVAVTYNNLGQIYQEQGNLEQATEYSNKALAINLKLFGENHPYIGIFYNNLGAGYQEQGNLGLAIEYSSKALAIRLKLFGKNHPYVATCYNNLGQFYKEQGNLKQALEYTKKALAIFLKLFGENHPSVATSSNNLGQIYQEQGDLRLATDHIKKALEINIRRYGIKHSTVALGYDDVGSIYQKQGNLEEAAKFINQALKINIELLDENHLNVVLLYRKLAQIYKAQGNSKKAAEYTKKARGIKLKL